MNFVRTEGGFIWLMSKNFGVHDHILILQNASILSMRQLICPQGPNLIQHLYIQRCEGNFAGAKFHFENKSCFYFLVLIRINTNIVIDHALHVSPALHIKKHWLTWLPTSLWHGVFGPRTAAFVGLVAFTVTSRQSWYALFALCTYMRQVNCLSCSRKQRSTRGLFHMLSNDLQSPILTFSFYLRINLHTH